ncbi:MAG: hypothetical protein ACLGHG_03065 [Gammaproteobacteria bacterium]
MSQNGTPDDLDAIPILLEAVPEAPESSSRPVPGRENQRSLFDELPPVVSAALAAGRAAAPRRTPAQVRQAALDELARRAPAIIDRLIDEHAATLTAELHARLRHELEILLLELADDPPAR